MARLQGIQLTGEVESAEKARRFVQSELGEKHPIVEDVMLLTSELVTNSIMHSNSGNGGDIFVIVADTAGDAVVSAPGNRTRDTSDHRSTPSPRPAVRVTVIDEGAETAPTLLPGDGLGEHGRGLLLVDRCATHWNHARGEDVTATWFEIEYAGRAAAGSDNAGDGPDRGAVGGVQAEREERRLDGVARRLGVHKDVQVGEVFGDHGMGAAEDAVRG
jgi:anti-sigma regulatory factor (Ser/Thr protein kinase)